MVPETPKRDFSTYQRSLWPNSHYMGVEYPFGEALVLFVIAIRADSFPEFRRVNIPSDLLIRNASQQHFSTYPRLNRTREWDHGTEYASVYVMVSRMSDLGRNTFRVVARLEPCNFWEWRYVFSHFRVIYYWMSQLWWMMLQGSLVWVTWRVSRRWESTSRIDGFLQIHYGGPDVSVSLSWKVSC